MFAFYISAVDGVGQKRTLETIYDQYAKQMFCLARSILLSDPDAEDAVHDVFVRIATRHMDAVCAIKEPDDLRNYLLKATKNTCLNYKRRREIPVDPADAVFSGRNAALPDDAFIELICARAQRRQLLLAMDALPEPYREVLYCRFVLEFSVSEIAKIKAQKAATIQKQLTRGKKRLLDVLAITGGEQDGHDT